MREKSISKGHIAFWVIYCCFLIILFWIVRAKSFKFFDYVIFISMIAFSKIIDHMLGIAFGLFYYVQPGIVVYLYAFFYDTLVFPTVGLIFTKLFPRTENLKNFIKYNVIWIAVSFLFELIIAEPLGVIVYTGWKVFPYSLVFYSAFFPILTWYKLFLEKKMDCALNNC